MPWRAAAQEICRRHGFPTGWVELYSSAEGAAHAPAPQGGAGMGTAASPRDRALAFEQFCLRRLASIWTGEDSEPALDGKLASYLVQRYLGDSARVLAHRYRLSAEEWEDIVAEAGERALRVFSDRSVEQPQAYLFRTVQRAVWEYLRKARRELASADPTEPADPAPDPEHDVEWREILTKFLAQCWERLGEGDRSLIERLELDGLSAAETGRPLGLGPNAVNVRKFRIRQRLRDCLRQHTGLADPFREGSPLGPSRAR
jgi:RNA polymerase sigma factor (sigma-70 family)